MCVVHAKLAARMYNEVGLGLGFFFIILFLFSILGFLTCRLDFARFASTSCSFCNRAGLICKP